MRPGQPLARNSAWHQLQRRLAQDLQVMTTEPRAAGMQFGLRAERVCWLSRASRAELPQDAGVSAHCPQQAA